MSKLNIVPLFLLFFLSLFPVSYSFVSQTTPTFYLSVGGCFLLAIVALIGRYKKQALCFSTSEILFACFLLFGIGCGEYMGSLSPEWFISGLSLLLFYMLAIRIKLNTECIFAAIVALGLMEAIYGLWQYVDSFNNYIVIFRMSGSFDNPAGFAATLSVIFPSALYLVTKRAICWRIFGGLASVVFIVAVALSHSRAGIVAIIVIGFLWQAQVFNLKWLKQWSRGVKILTGSIIMIAILASLYLLKKDSADGRLLIWQCTAKMIADKPLFGHGTGGFQRSYMLYQADYFKNHPNSSFTMLADNVKHPFNEFLKLLVEQGLVGGLFLGLFLFYLIREYRRGKNIEKFYAMLCLIGVASFASFSYMFCYPFIRLIALYAVAVIMKNESVVLEIPQRIFFVLKPLLLVVCVLLLVISRKMFLDEYRWNAIAHRSLAGETKEVMPDYERLYQTMNRNALFLYNYGAELNFIGESQKSNSVLLETARLFNDIDLQLLLAENYQKMKQYKEAENCLILASNMIPNRFIPLHRLFHIYKVIGNNEKAKDIAKTLLNKPIKIISPEVLMIKSEMEKELRN